MITIYMSRGITLLLFHLEGGKIMTEKGITCEIVRPIAVLSENERGYTREVNLVSWNGADPKYDIRNWHPGREKCGKGITLTEEEARALMDALKEVFGEEE